jgi:hypothetical protein
MLSIVIVQPFLYDFESNQTLVLRILRFSLFNIGKYHSPFISEGVAEVLFETSTLYQSYLAMRNISEEAIGKPIAMYHHHTKYGKKF